MTRFRVPALLIVSLLAIAPICSAQVRSGTVQINPFGHRCDNRVDWLSNGDVTGGLIFSF